MQNGMCYGFAAAWHDQCIVEDYDRHEVRNVRIGILKVQQHFGRQRYEYY